MSSTIPRKDRSSAPTCRRGSSLVITVIFATIISFGLAALLPMMVSDWKMTARTSAQEAAFSLAESGVEEAAWAILEYGDDEDAWTDAGWNESDDETFWYREWTLSALSESLGENYELDEGREGRFRVIVEKVEGSSIQIVSQGLVRGGGNAPAGLEVIRYIETEFARPNPFGYGLIARDGLDFNGRPVFDSYDSRIFPYDYSFGVNSGENVTVGSVSIDLAKLGIGNATIRGDLSTGASDDGSDPTGGATVTGDVIWDFEMDFPEVVIPDTTGWQTSL